MRPALYFAPTYFTSFFFPTLVVASQPAPLGYRDRDALAAVVAALDGTGEFADVLLGSAIEQTSVGADRVPFAFITPQEWTDIDDVDPPVNLRQVLFTLTLVVRDDDPNRRFHILDRLTSVAQNALDGKDLAGGCLPDLTKLRR